MTTATDSRELVLVTGGTGLVGQALQKVVKCIPTEIGVTWKFVGSNECNLCDKSSTEVLFEKYKPTHVVHLAARVGGLFANLAGNLQFYEDNMCMYVCA